MNRFQALARYLDELSERVEAVRNPQGHGVHLRLIRPDGSIIEQCEVDRPWMTITNTFVRPARAEPEVEAPQARRRFTPDEIQAMRRIGIYLEHHREL